MITPPTLEQFTKEAQFVTQKGSKRLLILWHDMVLSVAHQKNGKLTMPVRDVLEHTFRVHSLATGHPMNV